MEISEEGENLYAHVGMGEDLLVCNVTPKQERRPKITRKYKNFRKEEEKEEIKEIKEENDEEDDDVVKRRRVLPRTCKKPKSLANYDDVKLHQGHYHNIMSIAYQKQRQRIVTSGADGHTLLWIPAMDETLSDTRAQHIARLYEDDLSDDD
uniref:WD_REPEATS_REGION domain-containing protein n=2 Tax=Bursaphelenchus xylophilus TaxID=6326 RepID=A0A1I7RPL7_BURXY